MDGRPATISVRPAARAPDSGGLGRAEETACSFGFRSMHETARRELPLLQFCSMVELGETAPAGGSILPELQSHPTLCKKPEGGTASQPRAFASATCDLAAPAEGFRIRRVLPETMG
jgi:hypothetical protein